MKRQTHMTLEDEPPRWAGAIITLQEKAEIPLRKNKMWVLEYEYCYLAFQVSLRCIWNVSIHYVYVSKSTLGCSMESKLQGILMEVLSDFIMSPKEMGKGDTKLGPWVIKEPWAMTVTI